MINVSNLRWQPGPSDLARAEKILNAKYDSYLFNTDEYIFKVEIGFIYVTSRELYRAIYGR